MEGLLEEAQIDLGSAGMCFLIVRFVLCVLTRYCSFNDAPHADPHECQIRLGEQQNWTVSRTAIHPRAPTFRLGRRGRVCICPGHWDASLPTGQSLLTRAPSRLKLSPQLRTPRLHYAPPPDEYASLAETPSLWAGNSIKDQARLSWRFPPSHLI